MTGALTVALATVLVRQVLVGSAVDLGPTAMPLAMALLLAAIGLGLTARARVPYLSDGVALALLVPLRGPLCDGVHWMLPGEAAVLVGSLLSLVPLGFVLGRQLSLWTFGAPLQAALGVCVGVLLIRLGAAGAVPAWLAGGVVAISLATLGELRRDRRVLVERVQGEPLAFAALPVGFALGALILVLRRVVPGYAEPSPHATGDVLLVLLGLAILVAWPTGVLTRSKVAQRIVLSVGGAILAGAMLLTLILLGLYRDAIEQVELTRVFRIASVRYDGLISEWALWLGSMTAAGSAALGLVFGALGARSLGLLVLGAGFAVGGELLCWKLDPSLAPDALLRAGAVAALVSAVTAFAGKRALLLLPLAAFPVLMPLPRERISFEEVRRPGEFAVEAVARNLAADVTLFSTPGREAPSAEGRLAWKRVMTPTRPLFHVDGFGRLMGPSADRHLHVDGDEAVAQEEAFLGLRVGGLPLHAGHPPMGAHGSLGRLTRWFARSGQALCLGPGAELMAADLVDAGLGAGVIVGTEAPLGRDALLLLLDALGSAGWQAAKLADPVSALRAVGAASLDTVLVVPDGGLTDWESPLLTTESLRRARAALRPSGRCLVWVDTQNLDSGALASRLAAFGSVFGANGCALIEPRGTAAPFLLLVGWREPAGRPQLVELAALISSSGSGMDRVFLRSVNDLGALLLADGAGLEALAGEEPSHRRSRPSSASCLSEFGWAAVLGVQQSGARLSRVVEGASDLRALSARTLEGLARHTRYAFEPGALNETVLAIVPDIDWQQFDGAVEALSAAAKADAADPLLHYALLKVLEPLAAAGEYSRFARAFESCGAREMRDWRLALLESWVQTGSLEPAAAQAALDRAMAWKEEG
ncbi:MAG: hypothetical protein ACT4PU_04040 [Planctomycetota bacterium]